MTVHYRWHPLFGQVLPVHKRMKDRHGEHIFVELADETICSLPAWMFSPECAIFSVSSPLVAVDALTSLREFLSSLQCPNDCAKSSVNPTPKERASEAIDSQKKRATEPAAARRSSNGSPRQQTARTGKGTRGAAHERGKRKARSTNKPRQR